MVNCFMIMNKQLLFLILLVLGALQVSAQERLAGGFSHIVDVQAYPYYGKGFLTITNAHSYKIGEEQKRVNLTYDYTDPLRMGGEVVPLSLIVAVDGISAAGWTPERFYRVVDGRKDSIKLRLRAHRNGELVEYDTEITPRYELPDDLKIYGVAFSQSTVFNMPDAKLRWRTGATYHIQFDQDFDFFNILHYGYHITGDDPLLDKKILGTLDYKGAALLPQEKEVGAPDILMTVSKDANQRIETVYIPPTSRTETTGSHTTSYYNKYTKQTYTNTSYSNRTIREGGYTKDLGSTDLFLEIAALDYSRLNDSTITYAPIIWKGTATARFSYAMTNTAAADKLEVIASWMDFGPFDDKIQTRASLYVPLGVVASSSDPFVIDYVLPHSKGEALGLQPGDKLVRVNMFINQGKKKIKSKVTDLQHWRGWHYFMLKGDGGYELITPHPYEIVYNRDGENHKVLYDPEEARLTISSCFICP